ncbi:MAG: alpha/beta fold hydrolase [Bacteroidales bacterium]|nr:alpha/beta fold hydrolase [Bacteroidales bacterium]
MKKFIFLATAILCLASCKHDTPEYVVFPGNGTNVFTPIKEFTSDIMDEAPWDHVLYPDEIDTKATSSSVNMVVQGIVSTIMHKKIHQVVGLYRSVDTKGDSLTLSGKLFVPEKGPIKNLIVVSHYTIGSNAECPSESFSFEGVFAAKGYAVIVADYIGYGVTKDMVHPYLQAETTAHNVIDIALAVRPFMQSRGMIPQSDEVILVGYSQGGATTMHVQRILENDVNFKDKFKLKHVYCGAGPYNVAKTYDVSIKKDVTGIPCAVPMIIQGMSQGMSNPFDMAYFFKEPLLSNYDEWLNSKNYTVYQINHLINADKLSLILTQEGVDKSKAETFRLYKQLMYNSIPGDFEPKTPLFLFHSEDDQTVPFINSQLMERQFRLLNTKIEYDFDHYGSHQAGAIHFILKVLKKLD